jgi:hypothetical protein
MNYLAGILTLAAAALSAIGMIANLRKDWLLSSAMFALACALLWTTSLLRGC